MVANVAHDSSLGVTKRPRKIRTISFRYGVAEYIRHVHESRIFSSKTWDMVAFRAGPLERLKRIVLMPVPV